MGIFYNSNFNRFRTAKELLTALPMYAGKDGYYLLYPYGSNNYENRQLVYCDMTTDGGGWMLIARSHPSTVNYNGENWGWLGGKIGDIKDFSQAYQAGWGKIWHLLGLTFNEFIFGNRKNINDNKWGSFIYKRYNINYTNLLTSDTQQGASSITLAHDTSIYGSTNFPGMQSAIGYPITGTNNNIYYMRDCCGFSAPYGGRPTSLGTTYCGSDVNIYYSGPWCGGSSTDINGDFLPSSYLTGGGNRYGGTNQYMIMVR